jgi:hypothetical protein
MRSKGLVALHLESRAGCLVGSHWGRRENARGTRQVMIGIGERVKRKQRERDQNPEWKAPE